MSEIKVGQFGKIGENMVAFELSKRGWIVFLPPYDERVDIVAMKFICSECGETWNLTHNIHCSNIQCDNNGIDMPKNQIVKKKFCTNCNRVFDRGNGITARTRTCPDCNQVTLQEYPVCKKCGNEVVVKNNNCTNKFCSSTQYKVIFRSIQVKSTHLEDRGTLGFNFKYQDLLNDCRHFFIVYLREIEDIKEIKKKIERHKYWVLTKEEFVSIHNLETASSKIYQNNRLHLKPNKMSTYEYDENMALRVNEKIKNSTNINFRNAYKELLKKYDPFLKLDEDL